jgi:hypothetical protein
MMVCATLQPKEVEALQVRFEASQIIKIFISNLVGGEFLHGKQFSSDFQPQNHGQT